MNQINISQSWYEKLILDIQKIQFETIIKGKWLIGKRILKEQKKRKYGNETIKNIAQDLGISSRELWRYIQFAKKCHDVTLFIDKSWRYIVNTYLPVPLQENKAYVFDLKNIQPYDSNIFYLTFIKKTTLNSKKCLCVDITYSSPRVFKNYYPTITNQSIFTHSNGQEFSLREYANVQDFPNDFKFVGSKDEIRKQIGNAVSSKMAEYIINKHIKGRKYIDLFCGCGGFSLGAKVLNKKCLWAIDNNKFAGHSFKLNFPTTEICIKDIQKINPQIIKDEIGNIDFLLAGCPCQGFSQAGKKLKFEEDERNKLYLEIINFLKFFKPKQFIMENVPPILKYKNKIIADFKKIGYTIIIEKVNGLDIGMNQKRTRVFFIGEKDGNS